MPNETLICVECNTSWERERVRGRKPKLCPGCKPDVTAPKKKAETTAEGEVVKHRKVSSVVFNKELFAGNIANGDRRYIGVEIDGILYCNGMRVRVVGEDGTYIFSDATERHDGSVFMWLIGDSGEYEGKHRAIHPDRIEL